MLRKLREQSRNFGLALSLPNLFKEKLVRLFSKGGSSESSIASAKLNQLVKSKVASKRLGSTQQFNLCADPQSAEEIFNRLSDWLQEQSLSLSIDNPDKFFFEKGQLSGQKAYFFIQKPQQEGYLFHANEIGWQVFRAHKIVATDTFVRSAILFDSVVIYLNREQGITKPRLMSERFFGSDQVAFELYRTRLYQQLIRRLVA